MMTETDAKAKILAKAIHGTRKFGAAQANEAISAAMYLLAAKEIDNETFRAIMVWLGNHSALRQKGEEQGYIQSKPVSREALTIAVERELAALDAQVMRDVTGTEPKKK